MSNLNRFRFTKKNYSLVYNKFNNTLVGETQIQFVAKFGTYTEEGMYVMEDDTISINTEHGFYFDPEYTTQESFPLIKTDGLTLETGNYALTFTGIAVISELTDTFTVNLQVINNDGGGEGPHEPEDNPENWKYYVKYWFENRNVNGDIEWLGIYQKDFEGEPTEIRGTAVYSYQDRKDLNEAVISSNLQLELEADTGLTLQDLYSEDEMTYKVLYRINNENKFYGWIKPDGIYEDWVVDKWVLSIDVFDGLSTLKNLSFVTWDGLHFIGKYSILDVVRNCLERTGLYLPINVSLGIKYRDAVEIDTNTVLENVYVSTERYYQDSQKKEIMDCESVLKSLLQVFNATLIQQDGEWYIFRAIDIVENMRFKKYTKGMPSDDFKFVDSYVKVGSEIDDYEIHHCNANQKKSISASIQAHRIKYKYGNANSLVQNSELRMGEGLNCEGWDITNLQGNILRQDEGYGIKTKKDSYSEGTLIALNQDVGVLEGDIVDVEIQFYHDTGGWIVNNEIFVNIETDNYRLVEGIGWVPFSQSGVAGHIRYTIQTGGFEFNTTTPPMLEDSDIRLHLYVKIAAPSINDVRELPFKLNSIDIKPSAGNVKGTIYTAQRSTRISSVTKEDKTVYNGDSLSDLFVGTMYKNDQVTPTSEWFRTSINENKEVLEINAEDVLRIAPRPMQVFEGDVYGYFPYLTLLQINNLNGSFLPTKYSYDFINHTIQLESREFSNVMLLPEQFRFEKEIDYGNETKVTIQ